VWLPFEAEPRAFAPERLAFYPPDLKDVLKELEKMMLLRDTLDL
jgi:hypothetical protein